MSSKKDRQRPPEVRVATRSGASSPRRSGGQHHETALTLRGCVPRRVSAPLIQPPRSVETHLESYQVPCFRLRWTCGHLLTPFQPTRRRRRGQGWAWSRSGAWSQVGVVSGWGWPGWPNFQRPVWALTGFIPAPTQARANRNLAESGQRDRMRFGHGAQVRPMGHNGRREGEKATRGLAR